MAGTLFRLAMAAALAGGLAGCASNSGDFDTRNFPDEARNSAVMTPDAPLQCVPYARAHSGINIYGDAYTWWDKAAGRFARGSEPKAGAVLVLAGYAGPNRAHLAVVHDILSPREIRVDHANWLDDGAIYVNDPVVDVSPDNDWSQVKVWNIRAAAWGTRTYNVRGFIGPGPDGGAAFVARNNAPATVQTAAPDSPDSDVSASDSAADGDATPDISRDADEANQQGIPTR